MADGSKFAVFDIDGTLIRWQLYHAIADALIKLGYVKPSTYESMRISRMNWKRRIPGASFKTYEEELIKAFEKALLELTDKQFSDAAEAVFEEYKDQVYVYTRQLIADLKKRGYLLFAISGSQFEIISKIAEYYGFDDCVGSIYEYKGGRYTGEKIVGSVEKDKTLKRLMKEHNATMAGSIAVGDTSSDIAMLNMVERPIAFNPDQSLFEQARKSGWKVVIERKNVTYELDRVDGSYKLVKTNSR